MIYSVDVFSIFDRRVKDGGGQKNQECTGCRKGSGRG